MKNLSNIKEAVTSRAGRKLLTAKKNSPTIFFVAGTVGMVGATVLACRATLRLEEVLEEGEQLEELADSVLEESDVYDIEDRQRDSVKIKLRTAGRVAKLYAPAVAVGVVSIGALTGSHVTLKRRNAAVMAAYAALDRGFNEYRQTS